MPSYPVGHNVYWNKYNNIHCPKYFSGRYNIECSKIQPRNRILFNSKSCGSLHIYIPRIFVLKNDVIIFIQYFFFLLAFTVFLIADITALKVGEFSCQV